MTIPGCSFSREAIDRELSFILAHNAKDKLPWLRKDRREAEVGYTREVTDEHGKKVSQHDRQGLDYAQRELRRVQRDLEAEENPNHPPTQRCLILRIMVTQQEAAVRFWEGKIYLLDRVIAALESRC